MAVKGGRARATAARVAEATSSQPGGKTRRSARTSKKGLAVAEVSGAGAADAAKRRDSDADADVATDVDEGGDHEHRSGGRAVDVATEDGAVATTAPDQRDFDDSDAPDDVTFVQSKELVAAAARDARASASSGKMELKRKRRERNEKYKHQKTKKLKAIMANRLPDEVLQSLVPKPAAVSAASAGKSAAAAAVAADSAGGAIAAADGSLDDPDSDAGATAEQDAGSAAVPGSTKSSASDDFIPLTSDGTTSSRYRVSSVKDVRPVKDSKAAQFMDRFRCGGARVQREAFSVLASKREKRRARLY